ncbi:hypothetical protein A2U01_0079715, partial [Trifolium medium]|nr:hypothetical protein [Trifolium medium]
YLSNRGPPYLRPITTVIVPNLTIGVI